MKVSGYYKAENFWKKGCCFRSDFNSKKVEGEGFWILQAILYVTIFLIIFTLHHKQHQPYSRDVKLPSIIDE